MLDKLATWKYFKKMDLSNGSHQIGKGRRTENRISNTLRIFRVDSHALLTHQCHGNVDNIGRVRVQHVGLGVARVDDDSGLHTACFQGPKGVLLNGSQSQYLPFCIKFVSCAANGALSASKRC